MGPLGKILLIVFVGTHVPLVVVGGTLLLIEVSTTRSLLLILLISTVLGAFWSMLAAIRVLRPSLEMGTVR